MRHSYHLGEMRGAITIFGIVLPLPHVSGPTAHSGQYLLVTDTAGDRKTPKISSGSRFTFHSDASIGSAVILPRLSPPHISTARLTDTGAQVNGIL